MPAHWPWPAPGWWRLAERSQLVHPPLTALSRHDRESGELAAGLLLRVLAGDGGRAEVRIPLELILRRSCGCDPRG